MSTALIVVATVVPLVGVACYLALLVWAARQDGAHQRALEQWQREHRPRVIERRLRERRTLPPPRRLQERRNAGSHRHE